MSVTSYYKLTKFIDAFASAHNQVKRFQSEFEDQMPNFATVGESFPVLFMSPVSTNFGENEDIYTVNIYCYARILNDRSDLIKTFSDTQLILNDLKKYILGGDYTEFNISDNANAYPMREITMDYVVGNMMTIDISVGTYSSCEIPFDEAPLFPINGCDNVYPTGFDCDSLWGCEVFNSSIWTLDFMDAQSVVVYAPYDLKVTSIVDIVGSTSLTILDDGLPYVLDTAILMGSKIEITSSTAGVVNLNILK